MPSRAPSKTISAIVVALLVALLGSAAFVAPAARAATTVPNPNPSLIARWQPCQPDTGVTVAVDFGSLGDHKVYVGCALGDQPSGADAMKNAGFDITGTKQYGENFICRIDGLPKPAQESCRSTPGSSAYWSYWVAAKANDTWGYSSVGARDPNNHPTKGTFQGWSFSTADGKTVPPRIPPIDSRGTDVHNPAPLPTSDAAATLAGSWLGPVLRNITGPKNVERRPYTDGAASLLAAAAGLGVDAGSRAVLRDIVHDGVEEYVTGGDDGVLQSRELASTILALRVGADPRDAALVTSLTSQLRGLVYPDGAAFPAGSFELRHTPNSTPENGWASMSLEQPTIVRALLAGGGTVPAAAIRFLLSTQADSGEVVRRTCGDSGTDRCPGAGPVFSVALTVEFVDALGEVLHAGPGAVTGGGVDPADIRAAVTRAGTFLAKAQQADGGYVGSYPAGPMSLGFETTWTTAQAARGLAGSGRDAAARRAARWLAAMQFTPGTRAPADLLGELPADPNFFASQAANGLGADPATTSDATVIGRLLSTELPGVLAALRAWQAAPFRNAVVDGIRTTDVSASGVRVIAGLHPGTDAQQVRVEYGPLGAARVRSGAVREPAASGPREASVTLSGLRPLTTYTYQVTSSGGGAATASSIGTVTTTAVAGTGAQPDLAAGVAYLTAPSRLVGGTHSQPTGPTFTDFGLTMDTAFALAATGTANRTLARITRYVAAHADDYTSIGTKYASGGAVAKEALLAEVTGHDPTSFGGHDLLAALRLLTCSRPDKSGCAATGNYRYAQSVFGQALGVIAQQRAKDPAVAAPAGYLRSLQHRSGAFPSVIPGSDSEVDSTAMAAMALDLLPGAANAAAVRRALAWVAAQQLPDGGFPGAAGDSTNSAALAIQGLTLDASRYRGEIAKAQRFLAARQNRDGGFDIAAGAGGGSDLRASAQAVGGSVATSFGTLLRDVTTQTTSPGSRPPVDTEAPAPSAHGARRLADTGLRIHALAASALVLLVAGGVTVVAGRRRAAR